MHAVLCNEHGAFLSLNAAQKEQGVGVFYPAIWAWVGTVNRSHSGTILRIRRVSTVSDNYPNLPETFRVSCTRSLKVRNDRSCLVTTSTYDISRADSISTFAQALCAVVQYHKDDTEPPMSPILLPGTSLKPDAVLSCNKMQRSQAPCVGLVPVETVVK